MYWNCSRKTLWSPKCDFWRGLGATKKFLGSLYFSAPLINYAVIRPLGLEHGNLPLGSRGKAAAGEGVCRRGFRGGEPAPPPPFKPRIRGSDGSLQGHYLLQTSKSNSIILPTSRESHLDIQTIATTMPVTISVFFLYHVQLFDICGPHFFAILWPGKC